MKKYSIGLFVLCVVVIAAVAADRRIEERQSKLPEQEENSSQILEEGIMTKGQPKVFYLAVRDEKIVVYADSMDQVYEYTDISISLLPTELQEEIRAIKVTTDAVWLYNFLENYSS